MHCLPLAAIKESFALLFSMFSELLHLRSTFNFQVEKDKNWRIKKLMQNAKEWKDLYYHKICKEESSLVLLESSLGSQCGRVSQFLFTIEYRLC